MVDVTEELTRDEAPVDNLAGDGHDILEIELESLGALDFAPNEP